MRAAQLIVCATAVCSQALAQGEATSRCQVIPDPLARLACFDAVFPPKHLGPASPQPRQGAVPAPSASAAVYTEQFGLPPKLRANEVDAIEATVEADFYGWGPNDKIRFQNGQIWEVIDGSSGTTTAEMRKVKIKRGALGSFFLEFEGLNKSPRVRRIQ